MKARKQKRTNAQMSVKILTGLSLYWSVFDPLKPISEQTDDDITKTGMRHSNPVYRLMVKEIAKRGNSIIHTKRLKWHVLIECEFGRDDGGIDVKPIEMVIHEVLDQADGYYQQAIEDLFADPDTDMSKYIMTNVTCTILGNSSINENDFMDEVVL